MLILSLDTTTRAGSAALVRDGEIVAELIGDASVTHGQRLPADLERVLERAGVRIDDVDLFAVAAGPGSFTGLRVGIATVQGLAMAQGRKVVPVSVLEALARAVEGGLAGAWMDAQRGEVFATLYGPDGRALTEATSASPERTLETWREVTALAGVTFVGDGAVRYAPAIERETGGGAAILGPPALAGIIGRIARDHPERAVLPHAIVPIYIRRSDAELARAKRAAAEGHG